MHVTKVAVTRARPPITQQRALTTNRGSTHEEEATATVRQALAAGVVASRMIFPENGPVRTVETWRARPVEDLRILRQVRLRLEFVERAMEPGERPEVLGRIEALLAHYRVEPHPPHIQARIADDWYDDLREYPMWAVVEAAKKWRRTKKFKPQPSEIIELCEEACADLRTERSRLCATVEASLAANPLVEQISEITRDLTHGMSLDRARPQLIEDHATEIGMGMAYQEPSMQRNGRL